MTEIKALQAAFKKKELNQSLLASLEKLLSNNSVTIQQYESLKHGYQQDMIAAVSEISSVKSRLSSMLQAAKQSVNFNRTNLEDIRTEYNSRKISIRKYQNKEKKLTHQLDNLRREIDVLQKLIEAKSAADADIGYVKQGVGPGSKRKLPVWALAFVIIAPLLVIGSIAALFLTGQFDTLQIFKLDSPLTQTPVPGSPAKMPASPEGTVSSLADVIEEVKPSVVLIYRIDNYGREGVGSGVIVNKEGYILTNNHVVEGARDIYVFLLTGDEVKIEPGDVLEGKVVKRNSTSDLAVIKISSEHLDLYEMPLGNSNKLKQGNEVIAIGYPVVDIMIGLTETIGPPTVTRGIVSSMREIEGVSYIQTDTPFNPGNSGGALINVAGEMVGIPTLIIGKIEDDQFAQNLNFAVSIDEAKYLINSAVKK